MVETHIHTGRNRTVLCIYVYYLCIHNNTHYIENKHLKSDHSITSSKFEMNFYFEDIRYTQREWSYNILLAIKYV